MQWTILLILALVECTMHYAYQDFAMGTVWLAVAYIAFWALPTRNNRGIP